MSHVASVKNKSAPSSFLIHSYHFWDERGSDSFGQEVIPVDRGEEGMFLQLHLETQ